MLGWRFAFIILSIPALVAAPLVLNRFRQQRSVKSEVPVSQSSTQDNTIPQATQRSIGIGQALRPIALIVGLVMLMQLISGTAVSFIPIYLVDKHHIAATSAAMLMGMIRGAGIVGSLFGGWLSDWYGRKNTIILGLVATGPIIYLLTRLPFGAGLIAIFILFGMLSLMRQAAVQPFLMDSVPTHLRATIFGLYFGLGMEGRSLIQPVTGHFMDIFGIVEVFNVIALISVGFSVVVLISARSLKSRQPTR
jgi:MFS family permease